LAIFGSIVLLFALPVFAQEWQVFPLRENGSIPVWTVAGPFPNGQPYRHGPGCFGYFNDFLVAAGGEGRCEPSTGDVVLDGTGASVVWAPAFSDPTGLLDYINVLGVAQDVPGVAYAFCRVVSPNDQPALVLVRSNDGVRVWLNGEEVHSVHRGRGVDEGEADRVPVALRAGPNNVLVKVDQGAGGWGQLVVLRDPAGHALDGVTAAIQTTKPLRERFWSASLRSTDLVARTPDGPRQMLEAQIVSGGLTDVICRMVFPGKVPPLLLPVGDLPLGKHRVELFAPVLEDAATVRVTFSSASDEVSLGSVSLSPPRAWTIDCVQHTHTDIGYTRPQDELLPDFLAHIDAALDYCDVTDEYPPDAQFKWTCEASWPVQEYLRRRPPRQIERLGQRVAEGRIEVTGLFLNMLENPDEPLMAASLLPVKAIRAAGLAVATAMQDDVPGAAWCLADYLPDMGIKYLVMGVNNDLTPRPFYRPTAFWWASPSGKRLLTWRPDHYHTGNNLRIHLGDRDVFQQRLLAYLDSLAALDYPFDRVAVQYSGMQIDNSPPALDGVEMIRQWNEAIVWPRLYSATAGEFPAWVEAAHGDAIETYSGAWPNWWNMGHAFTTVETAEARRTQAAFNTTQGMLSMATILGESLPESIAKDTQALQEDLLFFDEHTFGAQENFEAPGAENSVVQWGEKIEHVWDAVKAEAMLREAAWGMLAPHFARAETPTLVVVNALPWARSGMLDVYIGHELIHPDASPRFVDVQCGEALPAQLVRSRFEGSYWRIGVKDVPPMGGRVLRIEPGPPVSASEPGYDAVENVLENEYYRIEINRASGAVSSIYDKDLDREIVAADRPWDLGQVVLDELEDEHFSDAASYRARSTTTSVHDVTLARQPENGLWQCVRITAQHEFFVASDEVPGLVVEIRLYKQEKKIELHYSMHRKYIRRPHAMYVAFPFAPDDGVFTYEAQGGLVTPGRDQLPGSSTDWHTIQNFLGLRGRGMQIVLSSDEIPLVQFGEINMGKWQYQADVKYPHVYSWVNNDYWTYGFEGNKESIFQWRYALTSSADTGNPFASQFGQSVRAPLVAKVLPPGTSTNGANARSTFRMKNENVALLNVQPAAAGFGVLAHVRELEGRATTLSLEGLPVGWRPTGIVNAVGDVLNANPGEIRLRPYEALFFTVGPTGGNGQITVLD